MTTTVVLQEFVSDSLTVRTLYQPCPDSLFFFNDNPQEDSPSCENIYYQESAGTGQTDYDNEVFTCGP